MRVPVYILPTNLPTTSNHLYELFYQNRLFKIVDPTCFTDTSDAGDSSSEASLVINALEHSSIFYPHNYCIIIKDSSVTNSCSREIADLILLAIDLNKKHCKKNHWELCYLCRWLDRCDLYREVAKVDNVTKIVKTRSPLGIQAIMFSPKGRDIVIGKREMKNGNYFTPIELPLGDQLNREISLDNISAVCMVPNLFEFNVLLSQTELDLLKVSDCRFPDNGVEEVDDFPGIIPFLWFLVVAVGIILLGWFFYQFFAKDIGEAKIKDPDFKIIKRHG